MTPEQLQQHCAAIGYPWVAMEDNGDWWATTLPMRNDGEKWFVSNAIERDGSFRIIKARVSVTYTGRWQDSLRGPKEAT